jgi:uncharacterized caspase-like protein
VSAFAVDGQRIALLIGNADYSFAPLRNPVNDVRGMENVLHRLGFFVFRSENADLRGMKSDINKFSNAVKKEKSIALFYYAGHAVQFGGKNYLLPLGFSSTDRSDISYASVCLDDILKSLESNEDNINIVILDACRTNPFDASEELYDEKTRSVRGLTIEMREQGLAPMKGVAGTFIAFSTSPGSPASDGRNSNGVYTEQLIKYLPSPAHTLEEIFKKVRVAVLKDSKKKQIPWERSSMVRDFYFIPPSKDQLTQKTVRDLLQEARVDIAGQRYGMAYKRLKLANKMAESEADVQEIQRLMKNIRSELGD